MSFDDDLPMDSVDGSLMDTTGTPVKSSDNKGFFLTPDKTGMDKQSSDGGNVDTDGNIGDKA
eukprot:1826125-Alexandrium_andersonii.AAC.1